MLTHTHLAAFDACQPDNTLWMRRCRCYAFSFLHPSSPSASMARLLTSSAYGAPHLDVGWAWTGMSTLPRSPPACRLLPEPAFFMALTGIFHLYNVHYTPTTRHILCLTPHGSAARRMAILVNQFLNSLLLPLV